MTTKIKQDGTRWVYRIDGDKLNSGVPFVAILPAAEEATIAVAPPAGGTVLIEFTGSMTEDIAAEDALWTPAAGLGPNGVVSAQVLETIPSTITAVRITASGVGARVEVTQ